MFPSEALEMPYENLYIYYINGKVPNGRDVFGGGFIGNWQESDSSFLFFSAPADEAVASLVAEKDGLTLKDRFFMPYEDWIGGTLQAFSAAGIRVVPPWLAPKEKTDRSLILLDPGVVFGSGTHATTRDCLRALAAVFSNIDVTRTIDLGCGTGLLSLASARMGSAHVLAIDKNYLAAETTRDNIFRNNLQDRVLAVHGCAEDFVAMEADLLVANIHYDVMKRLIRAPGFLKKKWFILSGLLRTHTIRIEDDLRHHGAEIGRKWSEDGVWYTLAGTWGF
ncbi:MAG: 50S ribosomal protein L11 methyltransferase [Thermodesulfobacteriota bacterium]